MKFAHLVRRLNESLRASDVGAAEEAWVRSLLTPPEWDLWSSMQKMDKFHSVGVANRLIANTPQVGREEIAAALLHDVGKSVSHLGIWGRVLATIIGPRSKRLRQYHEHEEIGARLCRDKGIDDLICELVAGNGPLEFVARLKRADDL